MKTRIFTFALLAFVAIAATAQNKIVINTDLGKEKISKHIYGHFSGMPWL